VRSEATIQSWTAQRDDSNRFCFTLFSIDLPAQTYGQETDIRGRVRQTMTVLPSDPQVAVAQLRSFGAPALGYVAEANKKFP
jgi:hypothetical protein